MITKDKIKSFYDMYNSLEPHPEVGVPLHEATAKLTKRSRGFEELVFTMLMEILETIK